ncbi:MAG: exosortase/archaeosortase family protein [Spartobacteria bacterium]|nr:exosortase/archaeosortase family protein [Spartobacteria bacterium]
MQSVLEKWQNWRSGFRWSGLSRAAQLDLAFWAIVAGGLFFLFHLHGNSQEIATSRHSLFLWLRTRWVGDYAYGMFLPLASLAAVWMRRREIAAAPRRTDGRGAVVVAGALFLHWAGVLAQQPRISAGGFILLVWGLLFLIYGFGLARWLLFPCGYLFLAIPLNFIDGMTAPLRMFATVVSAGLLNGFGLHVTRVGAGLFSAADNSFAFNVAPECSGLRSLLAMTALMGFYAWYSQKTLAKKWILFLCSVPVAIVANVCRIILVVVAAAFFGQETAMGLWHDYSGYPIFLIGIALMLALDRLLNLDYRTAWTQLAHLISGRASS